MAALDERIENGLNEARMLMVGGQVVLVLSRLVPNATWLVSASEQEQARD